ncbi:hypothetical protein VP1G_10385 [Cytospora mali]|nr:hypothetical protein VP1G_10385 [Valsa mali var. pyri (nom. inval.)]
MEPNTGGVGYVGLATLGHTAPRPNLNPAHLQGPVDYINTPTPLKQSSCLSIASTLALPSVMSDGTGDIDLLLEAVKSRPKFPRACTEAQDRVNEGDHDTTEKIFFENGGVSVWLAYTITKRAAESTAHTSGKGKQQRLLNRIEAQTVESRRAFASQVAAAIEPERDRIESIVKIARQWGCAARTRTRSHQRLGGRVHTPVPTLHGRFHQAEGGSEDAQGLVAAVSISSEGLLRLEVTNNKVEHIAKELFGTHIEIEDGLRYIYLHGTTKVVPNRSLDLKGCRAAAIRELLGGQVAEAVFATDMYLREVKEGRNYSTDCVSMTVSRAALDSAEICILLPSKETTLLRARLYA